MKSVGVKIDRSNKDSVTVNFLGFEYKDAELLFSFTKYKNPSYDLIEVRKESNNDYDRFSLNQLYNGSAESFTNGRGLVSWWKNQVNDNNAYQKVTTYQPELIDEFGNLNRKNGFIYINFNKSALRTDTGFVTDGNWFSLVVFELHEFKKSMMLNADNYEIRERIAQLLKISDLGGFETISFNPGSTILKAGSATLNEKSIMISELTDELTIYKNANFVDSIPILNQKVGSTYFRLGHSTYKNNPQAEFSGKMYEITHFSFDISQKRNIIINDVNQRNGLS